MKVKSFAFFFIVLLGTVLVPDLTFAASPNVVLILSDDQTPDSIPFMPYASSHTGWVTFDRSFLNNPLCAPSRASILTGQYSHHTGVEENENGPNENGPEVFDEDHTLATWLRNGGYHTGMVGKYLNGYPFGRGPYVPLGWDDWHVFAEAHYYNYNLIENGMRVHYGSNPADYSTDVLASKAVTFINDAPSDKPFFLMFTPYAPHSPRTPARRYLNALSRIRVFRRPNLDNIGIDLPRWVQSLPDVTRKTMDKERRKQYRTVLALDDAIQSIFNALNTKGILENTVVIYQSDNGYSFGSHRWVRKRCEYEEAIHVHMMVHYPGIATRNIGKLESNVDLAPTIADIAGVIPDVPVDGKSWKPLILEQPTKWRTGILIHGVKDSTKLPITYWGIRTTAWKYVEIVETGEKELYDLQNDPYELTNLANEPGYEMRQANLATKLANLRTS